MLKYVQFVFVCSIYGFSFPLWTSYPDSLSLAPRNQALSSLLRYAVYRRATCRQKTTSAETVLILLDSRGQEVTVRFVNVWPMEFPERNGSTCYRFVFWSDRYTLLFSMTLQRRNVNITLVDLQLDEQNSYLFTYNTIINPYSANVENMVRS